MNAGTVEVSVVDGYLCVEYITSCCWGLDETHLYVGTTKPAKSAPGQFPYKHEYLCGAGTDLYCIPLCDLGVGCGDCVCIAAHAVVTACDCTGSETAWACGQEIRPGKNWAMYFCVALPCANDS
jgi:hypothetical protein